MRWLVDGMNVIGSTPDGWWRDRGAAMARLVGRLETFATREGDEVAVVLDGRPRDVGAPAHVDVAFAPAPGPGAADDEIVRRVAADPAPQELVVVTSDRALAERVTAAGARVEGARAFRARLGDD